MFPCLLLVLLSAMELSAALDFFQKHVIAEMTEDDCTREMERTRLQLHRHRRLYLLWLQRVKREPTNPSSAQKDIREQ
ncbi:hypothetical protein Q5P01_005676 [Channa striata]|uniref:Uncharacterized protein n=1 Tax=Channa striata TaxID=64152 RepID=A0AA88NGP8_CHASR|nr:hypothetical protein Q5P01_005676 [Channa striata]